MPVIKKIVMIGRSRGIVLPKSWFEWFKHKYGVEPKKVIITADEEVLKIIPLLEEDQQTIDSVKKAS